MAWRLWLCLLATPALGLLPGARRLGMTAAPERAAVEGLRFLTPSLAREIRREYGSPTYVYSEAYLRAAAARALAFPAGDAAASLTVRFAMKACPNAAVLQVLRACGLHIDASSGFEAHRAMKAGFEPGQISISSQQLPGDIAELMAMGVKVNACSLRQLDTIGSLVPGATVGLRFNPGLGSGGTGKTNVGGPSSSFGIWHEWVDDVKSIVSQHGLVVERVHTHIGSGSDPAVWTRVAGLSLKLVEEFPTASTVNLGGGYKVGRMQDEASTDLQVVGVPVREALADFTARTGRRLHLEIEPGTYVVANAGAVLSTVQDKVSTGPEGHEFLKLDSGMTEVLRPSLYAAQHPLVVVPASADDDEARAAAPPASYVVVGHCCESGDLMTPSPEGADVVAERPMAPAQVGDLCVMEGSGAYCSSMSSKNYNSFPEAAEVMVDVNGAPHLIRRRQTLEQILENEVPYPL
mmetsp:Transcript_3551/g.12253  ORF Transcript_3551/g.12253 Transcript_3551/m.12253 type:complete len:464 (+) Transcript_3551:49-1440(+)